MRYTPFETMERMLEGMRRDVWPDDAWDDDRRGYRAMGANMDLSERDDGFVFTADLPGFEKDEIDLRLDDGVLHVSARHEETDDSRRRSRSIDERVSLPKEVHEDGIEATYRNGVLEVHLPIVEGADDRGHEINID